MRFPLVGRYRDAPMDVLLVTNRGAPGAEHWARPLAARTASVLAAAGHPVRWLAAVHEDEPPPVQEGAEVLAVAGRTPPFRKVQGRLTDTALDVELTKWLRRRPSQIVHAFGFGAPGSVASLWLGERMGARGVATVRAADVLCHRGTLVFADGETCHVWDDVERCLDCCTTPWERGLAPWQSAAARLLRWLGGLSPMPSRVDFQNRLEIGLGGLGYAQRVLVASEGEAGLLKAAGISPRTLRVGDLERLHGEAVLAEYERALA